MGDNDEGEQDPEIIRRSAHWFPITRFLLEQRPEPKTAISARDAKHQTPAERHEPMPPPAATKSATGICPNRHEVALVRNAAGAIWIKLVVQNAEHSKKAKKKKKIMDLHQEVKHWFSADPRRSTQNGLENSPMPASARAEPRSRKGAQQLKPRKESQSR